MISLLIIDANSHLRTGIQAAVEAEGGVEVIGNAAPNEKAMKMVERLHPDVVLMSPRGRMGTQSPPVRRSGNELHLRRW